MELNRRGKTWHITTVHPATGLRVRRSLKFEGPKQAAQKLAADFVERLRKEAEEARDGLLPVTIGDATDRYVGRLEATKKASAKECRSVRRKLLGIGAAFQGRYHMDPERLLHTLRPVDMDDLVQARLREGNGPQTIAHEINLLRASTRFVAERGMRIPEAMFSGRTKNAWQVPAIPVKTRYLSMEEFQRVYDHMDASRPVEATRGGKALAAYTYAGKAAEARRAAQGLLVALFMTGGRWSEVKRLTWDRIDTAELTRWAVWKYHADVNTPPERPEVMIRLWGNKVQAERMIGASDQICAVLWGIWKAARISPSPSPLVFPNEDGKERAGTCRAIARAMNACGLNRPDIVAAHGRATVHSLRHTFASLLIQNGADLAEVQDGLGHASLQMTRRYATLAKGATATKLGAILTKVAGSLGR